MEIEDEIAAVLDDITVDPDHKTWDLTDWTREVLGRLAKLGKTSNKKYWVCTTGHPQGADGGEWLYDLTWIKYRGNTLLGVDLVLESEWDMRSEHGEDPSSNFGYIQEVYERDNADVEFYCQQHNFRLKRPMDLETLSFEFINVLAYGRSDSRYSLYEIVIPDEDKSS